MAPNISTPELLIKIGGIHLLICGIFHLFFPKMFQWEKRLADLSGENKFRILNTLKLMNWNQLIFWLILAYISLFFSDELLSSPLGKSILTIIVLFWIIRILIFQPLYVGFKTGISKLQILFFIPGLTLFIIPWINAMFS